MKYKATIPFYKVLMVICERLGGKVAHRLSIRYEQSHEAYRGWLDRKCL